MLRGKNIVPLTQTVEFRERPRRDTTVDLRKTGIHPDFWYPVARSKQLKLGNAIGVRFAGDPIVLVRTE